MSDHEISEALTERELCKRLRDFTRSGQLWNKVLAAGVLIDDGQRTWTANDGRRGTWEEPRDLPQITHSTGSRYR